jgi:tetratricopeptide (TPR) repeat protein
MREQSASEEAGKSRPHSVEWTGLAAILAVVAIVIWHGTLFNGFVWRDVPQVAANLALRDAPLIGYFTEATTSANPGWSDSAAVFRPLRSLSYRLDFIIGGALNPGIGHAHNLVLHLLNAMLMLVLARGVGIGPLGGLFVSLLFLVHPVQSEAVCWLVCRDALMGTTLVLAGLVYAVRRHLCGWRMIDIAVLGIIYLLACLASPQAICFPLLLAMVVGGLCAEKSPGTGAHGVAGGAPSRAVLWGAVAVFAAVAIVYAWWSFTVLAGGGLEAKGIPGGWKVGLLAVPRSIVLLLLPADLTPDYSDMGAGESGESVLVALGVVLQVLVLVLIVRCWRVQAVLAAALAVCWLCIATAWLSDGAFFSERVLYMSMTGFALAAGLLAQRLAAVRMKAVGIAVGAILVLGAARSMFRVKDWSNEERLLFHALDYSGGNNVVMRQLMRQYFDGGDFSKATVVADSLLASIPAGPGFSVARAEPLRVKGMSLISTGVVEGGRALLDEAIAADPNYGRPVHDLGLWEMQLGRLEEAIVLLRKASVLMPYDGPAQEQLGIALESAGRTQEAEVVFRRASEVEWRAPSAARRLAVMLAMQGRKSEAADVSRRALRMFPGDIDHMSLLRTVSGADASTREKNR